MQQEAQSTARKMHWTGVVVLAALEPHILKVKGSAKSVAPAPLLSWELDTARRESKYLGSVRIHHEVMQNMREPDFYFF